jgi:23S rRNA pseudouridine1911/1915/1917 synthase
LEFIESGWTPSLEARLLLPNQALHASSLSFDFEETRFSFSSPLPSNLQNFLSGSFSAHP